MLMLILFWLSQTFFDLSPGGYRNRCFLVALCDLIVRRQNLEVATKRLLHQLQNTGVVFVPCSCMEVHPNSYFWRYRYFWGPWVSVICYDGWVLSEGHKNYSKDWCFMNSHSTFLFLTYLNLMNYGHFVKSM